MIMMTNTEYKTHVQELKIQFQKEGLKVNNPKKQTIAIITVCVSLTKFIALLIEILKDAGFMVDWYYYSLRDTKELNMELEIKDLCEHYNKVLVFENNNNFCREFAAAALETLVYLIEPTEAQSFCLVGQCSSLLQDIIDILLQNRNNFSVVSNSLEIYNYAHKHDVMIILDGRIVAQPFNMPIIKLFSWNSVLDEDKIVYDLSEEIALRIGGKLLGR